MLEWRNHVLCEKTTEQLQALILCIGKIDFLSTRVTFSKHKSLQHFLYHKKANKTTKLFEVFSLKKNFIIWEIEQKGVPMGFYMFCNFWQLLRAHLERDSIFPIQSIVPGWTKWRDSSVWPFQVGDWNRQTHVSPFQFGGEMAKHPCLAHLEIVHPMSGHYKWRGTGVSPFQLTWNGQTPVPSHLGCLAISLYRQSVPKSPSTSQC